MSTLSNLADTTEFRVALLEPSSGMLMATRAPKGFRLPRVRIPQWTRSAEEINKSLRDKWQLTSFILAFLNRSDGEPACAVAELIWPKVVCSVPDLELCRIESVGYEDLDDGERALLCEMTTGDPVSSGPFARLGWLKEAQAWIKSSISDSAVEFDGDFCQYNAGDSFALVRFNTREGRSYWLKATGEPNKHESLLTVELARLFPRYLPRLIAVREEWNAWVTEGAGLPLGDNPDLAILIAAVEALADLQLSSKDHIAQLDRAGCMDRRLKVVQYHLPELFGYIEEAMRHQTSTKVMPIGPLRLHEIRVIVEHAIECMHALNIPDCLVNGDINLNNILFDGQRLRFTDWAEGGIGNPFLTLQQVIQFVIRDGEHADWIPALHGAYRAKWQARLSCDEIACAFSLMPLLAMVDYLYSRGDWLNSNRRQEASFQSFARTLGRCMDRAAAELSSRKVFAS